MMVKKEVTEINDILNDQAQVSIKVTKDVKIEQSGNNGAPQNRSIPESIMHEDENYIKREQQINKLKQSIMGM